MDRRLLGPALAAVLLLNPIKGGATERERVVAGAAGLAALSDSLCADSLNLPHKLSFAQAILAATKRHDAGHIGALIIDRSLFDRNIRRRYAHRQQEVQEIIAEFGIDRCETLGRRSWRNVELGLSAD